MRLAESWALQSTTANAVDGGTFSSGDLLQVLAVPDGGQASYEFSYGGSVRTETAEITLTIEPFGGVDHQPGDLSLVLVSPSGTESNIFNRPGYHANCDPDGAETFVGGFETLAFTFRSEAFRGENSQGTWTLRAEDHNANGLQAVITDIAFTAHGGLPRSDLVYVFTDAFGTMAGLPDEGGRATLTDGPGIDTLNAAAVSGAVDIDLAAGETSILAGGSFAIGAATLIENAIGGDGGDTIAGNFLANSLSGMRGDDTLDGGDGDDVLTGGPGTDSLDGGPGVDHVLYEDSIDSVVVDLQAGTGSGGDADGDVLEGIENVTGSPHNDNLTGSNAENTLIGGGGNDYLVANSQGAGSFTLLADFEDGSFGTFESVGFANIVTTSNPDVGGLWAAFVDAGQFAAPSDTEIEAFLGLAPGKLDAIGGIADRGSAMRATRDVTAGDELSFDWLFTSGEAGGFFQDFAFFSYSYAGSGTSDAFELIDASYLPPHGNTSVWTNDGTGWLTSVFTAPETGTMTIGVGAINFSDPGFPSDLVVDNFVLNRDLSAFSSQGGLPQFSELETGEVDDGLFSNNVLIGGDGDDTLWGGRRR